MNRHPSARRFTLVELLIGSVAAAILVLTAGVMLVSVHNVWRRAQDQAHMQEDAATAVATLAHLLRQASAQPAPPAGVPQVEINAGGDRITVGRGTAQEAAVFVRDTSLIYSRQGRDIVLIARRLVPDSFTLTPLPAAPARPAELAVEMRLTAEDSEMSLATVLAFRN